ncbi:hypothetical protein [Streptomyces albus]|uniref:hypothetical protein n=1 Tax=Streptomyces albus TaxID=1888 RepID=UPI003F1CB717
MVRAVGAAALFGGLLVGGTGCAEEKSAPAEPRMQRGLPSAKVLRLHQLSVPSGARHVAYARDDGWSSYGLALTFRVPECRLDGFLRAARVPNSSLRRGYFLGDVATEQTGWKKRAGRSYVKGSSPGTRASAPRHDVTVDMTDRPREVTVYVTSVRG